MRRSLSVLMAAVMLLAFVWIPGMTAGATQSRTGNFKRNYSLTGDGATDMVNIAKAQTGRTQSQFGYTEAWCADFVSDCAILAGQTAAIPANGWCQTLRNNIINAGGSYVTLANARPGDVIFYNTGSEQFSHVELITGSGSSPASIGGNDWIEGVSQVYHRPSQNSRTMKVNCVVRPNYKRANPQYTLDVNVSADGAGFSGGHDAVTFDVYAGGRLAADDVKDFYQSYDGGTSYEVKDIRVGGCWKYTGSASYAGTLGANAVVTLPIVSNHTPEIVPGFDATCTATGLTDGEKCSVCGKELKAQEVIPAYGHSYLTAPVAATCVEPAKTRYACVRCGEAYEEPASNEWSEWSEERPPADASGTETKTQYRSSRAAAEWREVDRGTVDYAAGWPGGFDQSHPLYAKYNVKPVQAKETADERVTVETSRVGFIYWHWCYGSYAYGPINRKIDHVKSGTFPSFHAFYSAEQRAVTESANAIRFDNAAVCKDTYWWIRDPVVVNRCAWVRYERVNGDGWEDFGDWQDEPIEASPSLRVETRTLYRYKASSALGPHAWDEGVVTVEPLCAVNGLKTFTCAVCGAVKTEPIPATGHADANGDGLCDRCGERLKAPVTEPPVTQPPVSAGLRGDADLDGKVLAKDARIVLRASAKLEKLEGQAFANCDLDGDGKLTAKEARLILRFSARLEKKI